MAKMTIYGMASHFYRLDDDLFANLTLPDGIDKDTLTDSIILAAGDMPVLYGDPDFVQDAIGVWSKKWYSTFEKWLNALSIEYDPLNNYDRKEEFTESQQGANTSSGTSSDSTSSTGSSNTNNKISAFNSSTMQPDTSADLSSSSKNTGNSSVTNSGTNSNEITRSLRAYGNIGVTTSQQMLEAELSIAKWSIYEHITDLFLDEFVVPIYD